MEDDIDAVAAGQPWAAKQCAHSKERYDAIAREVKAFDWPSGENTYARTIRFDSQSCAVEVSLPQGPRSDVDRAAAKRRWGKDVRILTGSRRRSPRRPDRTYALQMRPDVRDTPLYADVAELYRRLNEPLGQDVA